MTNAKSDAIRILKDEDERIRKTCGRLRSLSPESRDATPLAEIGECLLARDAPPGLGLSFAQSLAAVAGAQSRNFPRNLFWDFEFLGSCLLARAASGVSELERTTKLMIQLNETFGRQSDIQFRYTHDFVYGFDWARWVVHEPEARARVGPFDVPFLEYLLDRGRELGDLIRENDDTYPSLPKGTDRNPFGFRRDPTSEEALHRDLSERRLIPIEAWRYDAIPRWDVPYREVREQMARSLGLMTTEAGGASSEKE